MKLAPAIAITRPQLWVASAVYIILSGIVGATEIPRLDLLFILAFVGGPGICGASEALNDYFDRGQDRPPECPKVNALTISGGTGILQTGVLSPRSVLILSLSFIATAVGMSLWVNRCFFILSAIAAFLAVAYSAPPIRLKERGFLSVLAKAFAYGFLIFHGGYTATTGCVTYSSIAIGSALSLFALGNTLVFDLRDLEVDSVNKLKTFPVQVGLWKAKVIAVAGIVGCFLVAMGFSAAGILTVSPIPFWSLCTASCLLCCVLVRSKSASCTGRLIFTGIPIYALAPLIFVPL